MNAGSNKASSKLGFVHGTANIDRDNCIAAKQSQQPAADGTAEAAAEMAESITNMQQQCTY